MDYSRSLINLLESDEQIIKSFSSLNKDMADFVKDRPDGLRIPTSTIIRFIVWCYDKESPLMEQHKKRWTLRKKQATDESGLMSFYANYQKDVDAIIYAKSQPICKIIIKYLSLLFDRDFLMYAVYSEFMIKQSEQLMLFGFDKPSDAARAKQNMESIQADLVSLEEKIFSGGDVRALKNVLYEESSRFAISDLRPENIVTKLEKGEPIMDTTPYGDDYVVEKMKFVGDI